MQLKKHKHYLVKVVEKYIMNLVYKNTRFIFLNHFNVMDKNILYKIHNWVTSEKPFIYKHSFVIESKEKNFAYIISKKWEVIWNKDYSEGILHNYNKEKFNIHISVYWEVTAYPKEIDWLDEKALSQLVSDIHMKELQERMKQLDIQILSSNIGYDEVEENLTFYILELEIKAQEKTKELILQTLLQSFSEEAQYTIARLYEILVTNYQEYWRDDGILIIDSFEEVSYKAVFWALLYFYYTGDIELIEHDSKSFRIKLLVFGDKLIWDSNEDLKLIINNEISPQLKEMITSGDKELERIFIDFNKDWKPEMLIKQLNIDSNKYNEVTLKKKYPFSKIITENHHSKSNRSIVFAKTKLNSKEK